jgi:hypothetical protein
MWGVQMGTNVWAGWRFVTLCRSTDALERSETRETPIHCPS